MAKTDTYQDKDFVNKLFEQVSEGAIIDAIAHTFEQDASWVLDWVRKNFSPEDIFDEKELSEWARNNGFQ